jgi:hypothetical protein
VSSPGGHQHLQRRGYFNHVRLVVRLVPYVCTDRHTNARPIRCPIRPAECVANGHADGEPHRGAVRDADSSPNCSPHRDAHRHAVRVAHWSTLCRTHESPVGSADGRAHGRANRCTQCRSNRCTIGSTHHSFADRNPDSRTQRNTHVGAHRVANICPDCFADGGSYERTDRGTIGSTIICTHGRPHSIPHGHTYSCAVCHPHDCPHSWRLCRRRECDLQLHCVGDQLHGHCPLGECRYKPHHR